MLLDGKKGLVLSVTNKNSIGWAVAEAAHAQGARVMVGAQNDRMLERVKELVAGYPNMSAVQVDFGVASDMEALVTRVREEFGTADFLVHSAAFAQREDLQGRFIETSREGFGIALDVSAYSLVALCRTLEPVLADDASVMAMSYLGSTRTVGNYNVMGVAKAALEACARYLAVDLGPRGIRVNVLSPGPINTVAARGVKGLTEMIAYVHDKSPLKREFGAKEVGGSAVYLMSDLSKGVTGQIVFIDNGYNIIGM
ncbi:MAG: SDR family oxidoreductase [Fimbriimonadaceae bacterium]|nr:SDR family oxidoreductase [Fimbriimonadaceae bacterium]